MGAGSVVAPGNPENLRGYGFQGGEGDLVGGEGLASGCSGAGAF